MSSETGDFRQKSEVETPQAKQSPVRLNQIKGIKVCRRAFNTPCQRRQIKGDLMLQSITSILRDAARHFH